jgi:hypothetical protein
LAQILFQACKFQVRGIADDVGDGAQVFRTLHTSSLNFDEELPEFGTRGGVHLGINPIVTLEKSYWLL